jgi:DNA-binding transcriptional ArsR family regulator
MYLRPKMNSIKRLEDPRTMRALAHPLRLRLLGLLRIEGPQTATSLARLTGESVPSLSYHLRQLSEHGFIEEAPELARDGRERWWKASHARTAWESADFLEDPERMAAEGALMRELRSAYLDALETWHQEQASWSREWVDASTTSDWILDLTPAQLQALKDELIAVIERWQVVPREEGAEHIAAILHLFPRRLTR